MSSSWLKLAHKTCIVTGAGSGIGAAVAKALAAQECHVVLADRNEAGMQEVVQGIMGASNNNNNNNNSCMVPCDVTDTNQVQNLIQEADDFASANGTPPHATLLVNCAGITKDNWISSMEMEEWDQVLDVNLKAIYLTCRHFLDQDRVDRVFPKGIERSASNGAIVNVGSIVSERGNLGQANYAASKGGVLGLTRALAKEVAIRNVNVNAVVPGFIHSPMSHAVPDHVKERMLLQIPQRRFGNPEEVADLVAFLLSQRSSYITGESIKISGMIAL